MSRTADTKRVAPPKPNADFNGPYGTESRRSLFPLYLLITFFIIWFAFLVVLALREAALR